MGFCHADFLHGMLTRRSSARCVQIQQNRRLFSFTLPPCASVGVSRVFMGAHFARDVTVGVLLSLAIFEGLRAILYRKEKVILL